MNPVLPIRCLVEWPIVIYLWWTPIRYRQKANIQPNMTIITTQCKEFESKWACSLSHIESDCFDAKTKKEKSLTRPKSSVAISQHIFETGLRSLIWWSHKTAEPNTNFLCWVQMVSPYDPSFLIRTNRPPSNGNILSFFFLFYFSEIKPLFFSQISTNQICAKQTINKTKKNI